ncbi:MULTISPECIES: pyridoxamine 5'-phosphate oxidase family protein [unclassified Streptomyces]|uniref:pyridoxamine 5'-phosphate oxidase family protein n=1 Tax=unclassified Streptomyces TaxID=2593676 RepID=UPI00340FB6C8
MTFSWTDFQAAEPDFAATVQQRFEKHTHHILATLRKDGSPRVTGLEVNFRFGELWLGMMPNSRKALDLLRDPRLAIHANPGADASMEDGDVRIAGRAVEVTDPELKDRFQTEGGEPLPFHLFRVELSEAVRTAVDGDELVLQSWQPGRELRTIRRGNDDSPARTVPH